MVNLKLKTAILERGISQRELARRSGIHESILSLISRGRYIPDPVQEAKIAAALGRDADELFSPSCRGNQ